MIKGNCSTLISLRSFAEAVIPLLAEQGYRLGSDFHLPGDPNIPSKYFTILFAGQPAECAAKVNKVLASLRIGPKQWRQIFAATPIGSAIQRFLGPDKSMRTQVLEVTSKKFSLLIAAALADDRADDLFTLRAEGLVFYQWSLLAKLEVAEGGAVTVGWCPEIADPLGIDLSGIT